MASAEAGKAAGGAANALPAVATTRATALVTTSMPLRIGALLLTESSRWARVCGGHAATPGMPIAITLNPVNERLLKPSWRKHAGGSDVSRRVGRASRAAVRAQRPRAAAGAAAPAVPACAALHGRRV